MFQFKARQPGADLLATNPLAVPGDDAPQTVATTRLTLAGLNALVQLGLEKAREMVRDSHVETFDRSKVTDWLNLLLIGPGIEGKLEQMWESMDHLPGETMADVRQRYKQEMTDEQIKLITKALGFEEDDITFILWKVNWKYVKES